MPRAGYGMRDSSDESSSEVDLMLGRAGITSFRQAQDDSTSSSSSSVRRKGSGRDEIDINEKTPELRRDSMQDIHGGRGARAWDDIIDGKGRRPSGPEREEVTPPSTFDPVSTCHASEGDSCQDDNDLREPKEELTGLRFYHVKTLGWWGSWSIPHYQSFIISGFILGLFAHMMELDLHFPDTIGWTLGTERQPQIEDQVVRYTDNWLLNRRMVRNTNGSMNTDITHFPGFDAKTSIKVKRHYHNFLNRYDGLKSWKSMGIKHENAIIMLANGPLLMDAGNVSAGVTLKVPFDWSEVAANQDALDGCGKPAAAHTLDDLGPEDKANVPLKACKIAVEISLMNHTVSEGLELLADTYQLPENAVLLLTPRVPGLTLDVDMAEFQEFGTQCHGDTRSLLYPQYPSEVTMDVSITATYPRTWTLFENRNLYFPYNTIASPVDETTDQLLTNDKYFYGDMVLDDVGRNFHEAVAYCDRVGGKLPDISELTRGRMNRMMGDYWTEIWTRYKIANYDASGAGIPYADDTFVFLSAYDEHDGVTGWVQLDYRGLIRSWYACTVKRTKAGEYSGQFHGGCSDHQPYWRRMQYTLCVEVAPVPPGLTFYSYPAPAGDCLLFHKVMMANNWLGYQETKLGVFEMDYFTDCHVYSASVEPGNYIVVGVTVSKQYDDYEFRLPLKLFNKLATAFGDMGPRPKRNLLFCKFPKAFAPADMANEFMLNMRSEFRGGSTVFINIEIVVTGNDVFYLFGHPLMSNYANRVAKLIDPRDRFVANWQYVRQRRVVDWRVPEGNSRPFAWTGGIPFLQAHSASAHSTPVRPYPRHKMNPDPDHQPPEDEHFDLRSIVETKDDEEAFRMMYTAYAYVINHLAYDSLIDFDIAAHAHFVMTRFQRFIVFLETQILEAEAEPTSGLGRYLDELKYWRFMATNIPLLLLKAHTAGVNFDRRRRFLIENYPGLITATMSERINGFVGAVDEFFVDHQVAPIWPNFYNNLLGPDTYGDNGLNRIAANVLALGRIGRYCHNKRMYRAGYPQCHVIREKRLLVFLYTAIGRLESQLTQYADQLNNIHHYFGHTTRELLMHA